MSLSVGMDGSMTDQGDIGDGSIPITVNQFCFPAQKGRMDIH